MPWPRPRLLDRDRARELKAFQRRTGYRFRQILLLQEALTHTSYASQSPGTILSDNERLEFLGDAVLGLVIAEHLHQRYPTLQEGDLTRCRSQMVSRSALVEYGRTLEIEPLILATDGRTASPGRLSPSTVAGAVEATIGAVYLDGGFPAVRKFLFRNLRIILERLEAGLGEQDYKSQLQETALRLTKLVPKYRVVHETGPEHEKWFQVQVLFGGVVYGEGWGRSKKAAEQAGAAMALGRLTSAESAGGER